MCDDEPMIALKVSAKKENISPNSDQHEQVRKRVSISIAKKGTIESWAKSEIA